METTMVVKNGQAAIMDSLDPLHCDDKKVAADGPTPFLPDVLSNELQSLNLLADHDNNRLSFQLIDASDSLLVESADQLALRLGCEPSVEAKVVTIVGNAGDGKSYALNKVFFAEESDETFATSSSAAYACTTGVWAAFEPRTQTIIIDTEGTLGSVDGAEDNENRRTCQLLKIIAFSDVVIWLTRAERIPSSLLHLMGDASKAYNEHFAGILDGSPNVGPSAIVFHEPRHTDVVSANDGAETVIRDRLVAMSLDVSAFRQIRYFGATSSDPNKFTRLRDLVQFELNNASTRSISILFDSISELNSKFGWRLDAGRRSFPDEHFTCTSTCSACSGRCVRPLNHDDSSGHKTDASSCVYVKALNNKQYLCLRCYHSGRRSVVVLKASSANDGAWFGLATYAWSGSVLECRVCGVIYRSRKHWFGNETPESADVVRIEISHLWPGQRTLQGTQNAGRRLLDGMTHLGGAVSTLSTASATRAVSGWMADCVAPAYWRPNSDITSCHACDCRLAPGDVHHCRACGEGFCDPCTRFRRPVPERGWGDREFVRVCSACLEPKSVRSPNTAADENGDVHVRRYGEKVVGTINNLATAVLEYPVSALKDSTRPGYWQPDDECEACAACTVPFNATNSLHHCRACGCGVCDSCSTSRRPVPARGWDMPVRVCDTCNVR